MDFVVWAILFGKIKKSIFVTNTKCMNIVEVLSKKQVKSFHRLPFEIYQNDSAWVPHLRQDVEKVFNPDKNKEFRKGKAIRWLLVNGQGKTIGRIAAFVSHKYSRAMEQPTGGMGFFECIDNYEAAHLLFDTAINWLKKQGMEAVDGPINFGEKNMFWGLQIENFVDMPSYGMNYNPAYYIPFFEEYGFKIYYKQLCGKRDMMLPLAEQITKKSERLRANSEYVFKNIRGRSMVQVADDFLTVYNNAWGGHHGFKKMKRAQAQNTMKSLKAVIDKDIVLFGYHKGRPISFYINIPELNEIFCHMNGNLNLWGKMVFLYHKWRKTPTTMTGIVFGVDREFQGLGVESAMVKWAEENIVTLGRYQQTVLTWIGDFNPKMMKVIENVGAENYRTLATYRYLFDRSKKFERMPIAR